jgi:(1->4)-alpha-D-glucan 1-alpha-D-glucosylmutase
VGALPLEPFDSETSGSEDSGFKSPGFESPDARVFVNRFKAYAVKAAREAKTLTSWDRPDTRIEDAVCHFIERILERSDANAFLPDFRKFAGKIAHFGILNSLSQTLIKLAAPGVPDIYQGSEVWNLSLVDPDNRRPVNFRALARHLDEILEAYLKDPLSTVLNLLSNANDGRVKLFLTHACLKARKESIAVFSEGSYIPIESRGQSGRHVVAFARGHGSGNAVAVAPRLLTGIVAPGEMPLGERVWGDTEIVLPEALLSGSAASGWLDAITGQVIATEGTLRLAEVLRHFPVALLLSSRK